MSIYPDGEKQFYQDKPEDATNQQVLLHTDANTISDRIEAIDGSNNILKNGIDESIANPNDKYLLANGSFKKQIETFSLDVGQSDQQKFVELPSTLTFTADFYVKIKGLFTGNGFAQSMFGVSSNDIIILKTGANTVELWVSGQSNISISFPQAIDWTQVQEFEVYRISGTAFIRYKGVESTGVASAGTVSIKNIGARNGSAWSNDVGGYISSFGIGVSDSTFENFPLIEGQGLITNGSEGTTANLIGTPFWVKEVTNSIDGVPVVEDFSPKVRAFSGDKFSDFFPKFYNALISKTTDINVLFIGDSIFADDSYTTNLSSEEQQKSPPLMISNNIARKIYDELNWGNTDYRRYDSGDFTEVGTFTDELNSSFWDDATRRPAITRTSLTGAASVAFTVGVDTWKENFIYRTDLEGSVTNTVSITEGNGKLQVLDKSDNTWKEANGFVFSMKHGAIETYRGNTKFQERLKFRAFDGSGFDTRTEVKTVTISGGAAGEHFMYWGVEYSKEEFMIKFINSARGSLNSDSMRPYHDDDVKDWIDEPDTFTFIFNELYFNNAAWSPTLNRTPHDYADMWNDYYYETWERNFRDASIESTVPWQKFESFVWQTFPSFLSNFDEEFPHHLPSFLRNDGSIKNVMDNYNAYVSNYNGRKEVGHYHLDLTSKIMSESKAKFGTSFNDAFKASGVTGSSLLHDGTHPNNYGCNVIADWILSLFKNR